MSQPSLFGETRGDSAIADIDGGSRGNPGPAGYGVRIEQPDGTVTEIKKFLGTCTNNVAEYGGLLAALRWGAEHGVSEMRIRSDSELLVKQMRVEYRVKNPGAGSESHFAFLILHFALHVGANSANNPPGLLPLRPIRRQQIEVHCGTQTRQMDLAFRHTSEHELIAVCAGHV